MFDKLCSATAVLVARDVPLKLPCNTKFNSSLTSKNGAARNRMDYVNVSYFVLILCIACIANTKYRTYNIHTVMVLLIIRHSHSTLFFIFSVTPKIVSLPPTSSQVICLYIIASDIQPTRNQRTLHYKNKF
jgi:hypothetical protein